MEKVMTDNVGQVDAVLFKRWTDAVALREAMTELEERLSERLERAAEFLQPWLEEQGYSFIEVEAKYARVNVARASWLNKKRQQPWVWFALDALFPYGFRKVQEEHPLVWVWTYNLEKDDRRVFQEHLTNRLRGKGGDWINEDCGRDYPAGHYISTHGDRERLALAQMPEALGTFAREALASIFVLGDDVEAALRETLGK
jgi:hypothetical protein